MSTTAVQLIRICILHRRRAYALNLAQSPPIINQRSLPRTTESNYTR